MAIPPVGPSTPPPSPQELSPAMLNSPFAKMFEATGAMPTVKELQAIINGILKQQIDEIKKSDASWKRAMQRMKEAAKGD